MSDQTTQGDIRLYVGSNIQRVPTIEPFAFLPVANELIEVLSNDPSCDISWLETEGHLGSISIAIVGVNDSIGAPSFAPGPLRLIGGSIASDGFFGGCFDAQCTVTGFWQSDLPLPEQMSAVLLLTGLFGMWLTGHYRSASAFPKTGSSTSMPR